MPALSNPRHEHFASLVAAGETPTRAYLSAGYSPKGAATSALRLRKNTEICARIAELSTAVAERSVERAAVDRAWVLAHLKENVARAMQAIPVKDAEGNVIGDYKWEGAVANRGLELIGKELGMFRERVDMKLEADVNNVSMTLAAVLSTEELLRRSYWQHSSNNNCLPPWSGTDPKQKKTGLRPFWLITEGFEQIAHSVRWEEPDVSMTYLLCQRRGFWQNSACRDQRAWRTSSRLRVRAHQRRDCGQS